MDQPERKRRTWWQKAIIGSIVWIVLLAVGSLLMLQRIDRLANSPAHAEAWSEKLGQGVGMLFVFGEFFIWGFAWERRH